LAGVWTGIDVWPNDLGMIKIVAELSVDQEKSGVILKSVSADEEP
jgi:hypothetical protein